MMRATLSTASTAKTVIESQNPSAPDSLTAALSEPRPAAMTWKLVIMSLPWKLNSTDSRTLVMTISSRPASHSQTTTLSGPVK